MSKRICEESRRISLSWLKKNGYMNHSHYGGIVWTSSDGSKNDINYWIDISGSSPSIRLIYTVTFRWEGVKKDFDYHVPLVTQNCFFGGFRWWFICPLYKNGVYCGKKAGNLYFGSNGYYGCRICTRMAYRSQNESRRGYFGRLSKALDIIEARDNIRIKYWKGQPTKRYQRLCRKALQSFPYLQNSEHELLETVAEERKILSLR